MTRLRPAKLGSSDAEPTAPPLDCPSISKRPQRKCGASSVRATPETKAKRVLKLERARQRTAIRCMDVICGEMASTTKALMELLSDPAFVALLRAQGLTRIPKLVHQRLMEQRR